jgi:hypothetical protein
MESMICFLIFSSVYLCYIKFQGIIQAIVGSDSRNKFCYRYVAYIALMRPSIFLLRSLEIGALNLEIFYPCTVFSGDNDLVGRILRPYLILILYSVEVYKQSLRFSILDARLKSSSVQVFLPAISARIVLPTKN